MPESLCGPITILGLLIQGVVDFLFHPVGCLCSCFSNPSVRKVKGKGLPYSLPSFGPEADPGVQAVSPQVTIKPGPH